MKRILLLIVLFIWGGEKLISQENLDSLISHSIYNSIEHLEEIKCFDWDKYYNVNKNDAYVVKICNIDTINLKWSLFILPLKTYKDYYNNLCAVSTFTIRNFTIGGTYKINKCYCVLDTSFVEIFDKYYKNNRMKNNIWGVTRNNYEDLLPSRGTYAYGHQPTVYFEIEYYNSITYEKTIEHFMGKKFTHNYFQASMTILFNYHALPERLLKVFNLEVYDVSDRKILSEEDIEKIRIRRYNEIVKDIESIPEECQKKLNKKGYFYTNFYPRQYGYHSEYSFY